MLSLSSAKEPCMTDEELREVTRKTADMLFGPPEVRRRDLSALASI